jgi:RecQ family ATP-dependent DNA helicase
MLWTDKAKKYLKKYWKIKELKDKQIEVINELLLGNDVIGLLPTGYGKSMCYLIPPLVTKKIIFIISPLISLMDDQKDKLNKMDIPCAALHGNNKNKDQEIFKIMDGEIKIVYMSPEYLIKSDGLELAKNLIDDNKLGFLAVDESHCISAWGQDFRPEYTKIKIFREMFSDIPILAVTATATETVCQDISKNLQLNNPVLVRASFDRPNLYLKIQEIPTVTFLEKPKRGTKMKSIQKQTPKEDLAIEWIKKYPNDKIIIYTNSRKDTEELSIGLNKMIKNCCDAYHAGLSKGLREQIQSKFMDGDIKVIVSTIAFGMGIDQTVKVVIIFGAPSSIEEYYQQIGRGGRDGKPCETILYFDYGNLMIAKHMLRDIKMRWPMLYKCKINNLTKVGQFAYLNTCRRKFILEYFNESCDFFTCGNCDNCCENELIDITDKVWPIVMRSGSHLLGAVNEIRNKYLIEIIIVDKNNKDKVIELDLMDPLWKWKVCIQENKISKNNIPDKLRIRIPKKFIKLEKPVSEKSFDEKISIYEKLLDF